MGRASATAALVLSCLALCAAYNLPPLSEPRATQAAVAGDWIFVAAGESCVPSHPQSSIPFRIPHQ